MTVSYFEWVQDLQSLFWSEREIETNPESIMVTAIQEGMIEAEKWDISRRIGAQYLGVGRIAIAAEALGIYP